MSKRVCIILLNWHGWRDTLACIHSLESLDYRSFKIVVVDNGSTDDSVARIREAYPNVTILESGQNLGFAGGNNIGIRYALDEGVDYVWLLNNDTTVDPWALSALVQRGESDDKVGAVGSVLYYMDRPETVQAWGGGRISSWAGVSRHYAACVPDERIDYLTAASLLLRREALETVGVLESAFFMYWEDADLGFRLRKAGWKLVVAADSQVWHKEHASFGTNKPVLDMYFNASAVLFFMRHARMPGLPILIGVGGRLLKRVLRGDWTRVRAVLVGLVRGARRRRVEAARLR